MSLDPQFAEAVDRWAERLAAGDPNPALIARCTRLGRLLGGAR